jgi:suppressor of G2 allele of SKP1
LIKNAKQDDVRIHFSDKTMSCNVRLPDEPEYTLGLHLQHQIVPARSSFKLLSSKIEIKMQKAEGIRWTQLEAGEEEAASVKQFKPSETSGATQTRNWDKIATDLTKEDDEKGEGDAALNQLFQKIYAEGTDEVKMAMNKSFMESGGTVLSTNWKEVGKDKVPVKPPDGMEFKKWDV